jgi:hypothetical protein
LRGGGLALATSVAEVVTVVVFGVLFYPLLRTWELEGVAATVTLAEGSGLVALLGALRWMDRGAAEQAAGAPA